MKLSQMAVAGLLVASPMFALPVQAQVPPVLVYTQPLSPAATAMIQEKLAQAGVYTGRPDGIWGPDSQTALERFQQTRSLQVTGQLNQATVATLGVQPGDLLAARAVQTPPAAATEPPMAETMSPSQIRGLQARLRELGFYRGIPDGRWGSGTQAAMSRFQQARGLPVTGQMSAATAQALQAPPPFR